MPELEPRRLTSEQKTGFVLLLIFGFLSIGLGFVQMRQTLYSSLYVSALEQDESGQVRTFFDEETKLQRIDTDQDGINDYEELSFHETSPYLPDTDSDGFSDKTEIDNGTNPLCAEGEVCQTEANVEGGVNTSTITSPLLDSAGRPLDALATQLEANTASSTSVSGAVDTQRLLTDPAYARQILLQSGQVSAEELQKVDDASLLQAVQELIAEQSSPTSTQ